jgi:hypothetical protein
MEAAHRVYSSIKMGPIYYGPIRDYYSDHHIPLIALVVMSSTAAKKSKHPAWMQDHPLLTQIGL